MKTYTIHYQFEGYGEVDVKANSEAEAEELFSKADWQGTEEEWSENSTVTFIEPNE